MALTPTDQKYLRQTITLAREALEAGDPPFGSILVSPTGKLLHSDRNRIHTSKDSTYHPELKLAQWAEQNIRDTVERAATTVYTSSEHCSMCSAAHIYCGLGRIVFVSSVEQLGEWEGKLGIGAGKVKGLGIRDVVGEGEGIEVVGPAGGELVGEVRELFVERAKRELESVEERVKREGDTKALKSERARRIREGIGMVEM